MVKLKCWKKRGNRILFFDKGNYPKHDGLMLQQVRTSESPSFNKKWVWEFYREYNDKPKERKLFKSKTQALKFANKYMKKHDKC